LVFIEVRYSLLASYTELIRGVRWHPNEKLVASAADDGKVKLFDLKNEKILHIETIGGNKC